MSNADPLGAFMPDGRFTLAGAADGPLAGLSFATKDIIDIAGHRTSCGNPDWLASHPPAARHAGAVTALLDAGATFAGKAVTEELATGLTGENTHYGTPVNANAPGRVAGGSSSGSAAAVAGGLVDFALGSDTGGSVRAPASFCGIYGLRPSHGRVSLDGVMVLAASLDTIGWFARDAATLARVGDVLLGPPAPARPGRLLVADDSLGYLPDAARAALEPAIERVADLLGPTERVAVADCAECQGLEAWATAVRAIWGREAWQSLGPWITATQPHFGSGVAARFRARAQVTEAAWQAAEATRVVVVQHMAALLADSTVLALPAAPGIAPRRGGDDAAIDPFRQTNERLSCVAGLARLPQISLPLAILDDCPLGLGLVAAHGHDHLLLDIARRLADAL